MAEMSIYQKLIKVQTELKAPKGQYNSFGNYPYRSAEDILEALKPLLLKNGLTQIITDEIVQIGDRYYIKAIVTIFDDDGKSIQTTAYAREELAKKGMDGSQITGSASSYARKYALNGMYAIDDTKDADTDQYQKNYREAIKENPNNQNDNSGEVKEMFDLAKKHGVEPKFLQEYMAAFYQKTKTKDLTFDEIKELKNIILAESKIGK